MLSIQQFPTLWDPQELFLHLAAWAGVPVIVTAIMAALLGIYKSVRDWADFGQSTVRATVAAKGKLVSWTTSQQRAMLRLVVLSVLTVAFSYMVAVIIAAVVQAIRANPDAVFSLQDVVDRVAVTPWPPAAVWTVVGEVASIGVLGVACIADLRGLRRLVTVLGGVAWMAAWLVGLGLGADAAIMCLGLLIDAISPPNSAAPGAPPVSLLVTVAVTGLLSLVLAQLLPRVRVASADTFDSR